MLKRAHAMRCSNRLADGLEQGRAPGLPLKSADEALILASIVEKETGTSVRPQQAWPRSS